MNSLLIIQKIKPKLMRKWNDNYDKIWENYNLIIYVPISEAVYMTPWKKMFRWIKFKIICKFEGRCGWFHNLKFSLIAKMVNV